MAASLFMLDLVRTFYWFDEQLRSRLEERGWGKVTRSQSLVLANLANGETRAARIAENLGISRQAMSQLLTEMEERKLVALHPDPTDRRARIVAFAPEAQGIRADAQAILRDLEGSVRDVVGEQNLVKVTGTLRAFLATLN
ncbi:MarR family winged helix-turn-helix transcriptional regulator [Novosphingobium sp.]|uniref:MarR family winged helix-turn-helix transcriptional regulator n=1 Tax=Novosphingobium sp. TaxID=1874826 RepID=UPI0027365D7E|nr:helix-turn-helix domain-containing protein [Novosphingobium sp.]MDP3908600.1 helix-turn-helix domain-containing protein [Novosphingobium sp.]